VKATVQTLLEQSVGPGITPVASSEPEKAMSSSTLVTALYSDPTGAHTAIESLLRAGYDRDQITVIMSDSTHNRPFGPTDVIKSSDHTRTGATVGGVVGAVLTGLVTVGAFAAAGPLALVLAGVSFGGMTGSLVGALVGSGVPDDHAKQLNDELERGGIIVGAHTDDGHAASVKEALKQAGGRFVQTN
jgi:uncharacterized membrane protein